MYTLVLMTWGQMLVQQQEGQDLLGVHRLLLACSTHASCCNHVATQVCCMLICRCTQSRHDRVIHCDMAVKCVGVKRSTRSLCHEAASVYHLGLHYTFCHLQNRRRTRNERLTWQNTASQALACAQIQIQVKIKACGREIKHRLGSLYFA